MGFNIDLEKISLGAFKEVLIKSNLVPSRMLLKEYAEEYFPILEEHGFKTVEELRMALKNKRAIGKMAEKTKVPENYLTVLAREVKGYRRSPIKLEQFAGLEADTATRLAKAGIKNTQQLYDQVLTAQSRTALCKRTGIEETEMLKVTQLTDLTRIRWVNHTFAYVLHEAGFDRAEKVALIDPEVLYQTIKKLNEERKFFRPTLDSKTWNGVSNLHSI